VLPLHWTWVNPRATGALGAPRGLVPRFPGCFRVQGLSMFPLAASRPLGGSVGALRGFTLGCRSTIHVLYFCALGHSLDWELEMSDLHDSKFQVH
jgi:hypothetical protein